MRKEEVNNRVMHAISKVFPGDKIYMDETVEDLRMSEVDVRADVIFMLENEFSLFFNGDDEYQILYPTNTLYQVAQEIHRIAESR